MWNYIVWRTTVNLTFLNTFTVFFVISIGATHGFFPVSMFATCLLIIYVDSCWMSLPNTLAYFSCCFFLQSFSKSPSFCKFPITLPMLGNILGSSIFLSSTVSTTCLLFSSSSQTFSTLIVSFSAWIVCLISSWVVSILPVSSSVTPFFFLIIVLILELLELLLCYLNVSIHYCCLS